MSDKDGMKMFGYNTTPDTASNDNISVDARDEIARLTAESRRLHRELEAAREQSDHGGYCNLHGRHLGYKCPECPYEDRIAELEHQLAGFRWHRVNYDDPSTLPEIAAHVLLVCCYVGYVAAKPFWSEGWLVDAAAGAWELDTTDNDGDHLQVRGAEVTHWREIGELPSALPTGASE